jgi:phenylpyruvate tautomerase PptA (4-oxalocrotonate tautomerase family)
MYYSKPYVLDHRSPENTKDILKILTEAIPVYIGQNNRYIIVFLDEFSPQIHNVFGDSKTFNDKKY